MSWNYRVLAFVHKDEVALQICEVYYDTDGKPNGYADGKTVISTEGIKGLKWVLSRHKEAISKPILYGGERFPEEYIEEGGQS